MAENQTTPERTFISGSYTNAAGERVQMTAAEAQAIWDQVEAADKRRAEAMPDEKAALRAMHEAWQRLKELGWSEAIYCPKDGSSFDVIEAGSTGIHRAHYYGEWPTGGWTIEADGGCPSRPILFRLDPEAEAARKAKFGPIGGHCIRPGCERQAIVDAWPSGGSNRSRHPTRALVFRCAECEAVWRTERQRDLCCTAKPETVQQTTAFQGDGQTPKLFCNSNSNRKPSRAE